MLTARRRALRMWSSIGARNLKQRAVMLESIAPAFGR
jgi:hypothetical protein